MLNQEGQLDIKPDSSLPTINNSTDTTTTTTPATATTTATTTDNNNTNNNSNPLYDHDYCSPNKRLNQQTANVLKQKSYKLPPTSGGSTTTTSSDQLKLSTSATSSGLKIVASTSSSPDVVKNERPLTSSSINNNTRIIKTYSNDNLSDSSSSSSSVSSSKDLVIAQQDSYRTSLAPKDTPSIPRRKPKRSMEDHHATEEGSVSANVTIRSKRAQRQTTSVTDKSEWITGDDQIDSVLSEHLEDQPQREKRHKPYMDPAYSQFSSSDYSSSDAESDQDSDANSEDDPNKLWCVCQKPHEGKFMIRCDVCMDWFHGHCVGVTKLMGDRFEKQGKEWFCSECRDRLNAGEPRNSIPKKRVKKESKKKKQPIPGKRGRGRPRKSETIAGATRSSQRTTRKSSSSLDPKMGVDNGRLRKNLARSDARSESFDEFEDSQRLKELIKERKKEFFYKRHLAEQQKAAKRNELGLGKQSLTAYLSDSLDSLATSTNTPNMNNLPINIKSAHKDKERPKPNIVLQINTKKDTSSDQGNSTSRIVTAIVRSPKKTKPVSESLDATVNDLFTAEPIQISKKVKPITGITIPVTKSDSASTPNNDVTNRKRSNSTSSSSKNEKSLTDATETTPAKKKRKDSESNASNGSTMPIESKHIVQKIKESLEQRSKQIKDIDVPTDKIEKLAAEIEGQLNECFKEGTQKYLNKFRSLVFNLRDPKNLNLVKNVLSGEILPSRLVRMSPDEMASHELAKWRERENKHSIELIKRDAQMAAQQVIVKKTHKGEEVISAPSFNESDEPSSAELDKNQKPTPPPTTPTKQIAKDGPNDGQPPLVATIVITPPPPTQTPPPPAPATFEVINDAPPASLKMKITGISSVGELAPPIVTTPPSSSLSPPSPNQQAFMVPKKESAIQEICWSGTITMPDIAKFSASAKPVSGTIDFMSEEVNQNLMVCGRIAPDQVQGYIKKLKTTTKNQILIVQLFPLTPSDKSNFDVFFDYLYSRNRYGVIQTSQEILKDFYVLPIHENGSLPEILKPIKGPGIDRKEPNCLLGLLVRSKRVGQSAQVTTYTPTPINN